MSPILVQTIQFFLSLSLLIVLHEMGHFIPAKMFKTRVEKFYLFFDIKFSLFKKKIGGTEYGIGWLPLGGYVKIAGMIDESMDTEAMKEEPKPWEFRSKPAWQRLIIMLGGVTVNFLLAVVIYIGMAYSYGDQYVPMDSLEGGIFVREKVIGDKLGVQTGDKIVAVDGEKVENFDDLFLEIVNGNSITINRDGQVFEQTIPVDFIATLIEDEEKARFIGIRQPFIIKEISKDSHNKGVDLKERDRVIAIGSDEIAYFDQAEPLLAKYAGQNIDLKVESSDGTLKTVNVKVSQDGKLGVAVGALTMQEYSDMGVFKIETQKYTFLEAIPAGIDKGVTTLTGYVKQLKKIFNPEPTKALVVLQP